MNDYEPTPEQCDSLERDIVRLTGALYHLGKTVITAILARQHSREKGLLEFVTRVESDTYGASLTLRKLAARLLEQHAALDAAPEPTLLEAAKAAIAGPSPEQREFSGMVVTVEAWRALKAAVERAEKERAK